LLAVNADGDDQCRQCRKKVYMMKDGYHGAHLHGPLWPQDMLHGRPKLHTRSLQGQDVHLCLTQGC
jgi:hypothetical protein